RIAFVVLALMLAVAAAWLCLRPGDQPEPRITTAGTISPTGSALHVFSPEAAAALTTATLTERVNLTSQTQPTAAPGPTTPSAEQLATQVAPPSAAPPAEPPIKVASLDLKVRHDMQPIVEYVNLPPAATMTLRDFLAQRLGPRFHPRTEWAGHGNDYAPRTRGR